MRQYKLKKDQYVDTGWNSDDERFFIIAKDVAQAAVIKEGKSAWSWMFLEEYGREANKELAMTAAVNAAMKWMGVDDDGSLL